MLSPEFIGQILGIVAVALFFSSYQVSTTRVLLILQTIGTATLVVHYFLIGATSGYALNIVCIIRNIIYYISGSKPTFKKYSSWILAIIMGVIGCMSCQNVSSLLIILALMINTVCLSCNSTQFVRKSVVLTSSMLILYNVIVQSYGGIINESISVVSSVIGIFRNKNKKSST